MTPQERELVTRLIARLSQQAGEPKDAEADALIRQAVGAQPDAPYLLVQTVLIQDMALDSAHSRIAELERRLTQATAAAQPASFLGGRGSVPSAGVWAHSAPPAASTASAWSQSTASSPASVAPARTQLATGTGSSFLRKAASTAAGIAGGALLFEGIRSLFSPHYGGGYLTGMPTQPGINETVVSNDDDQDRAPDTREADADAPIDPDQNYASDEDVADTDIAADQDFGAGNSGFDI
jgi:uncharacterized protein